MVCNVTCLVMLPAEVGVVNQMLLVFLNGGQLADDCLPLCVHDAQDEVHGCHAVVVRRYTGGTNRCARRQAELAACRHACTCITGGGARRSFLSKSVLCEHCSSLQQVDSIINVSLDLFLRRMTRTRFVFISVMVSFWAARCRSYIQVGRAHGLCNREKGGDLLV